MSADAGRLYVVSTPIGNLGDITRRAVSTLQQVELIAAEDTRRTRSLLSHLGIQGKRLESLDAHAAAAKIGRVVDDIAAGVDAAIVTDAGTPGISDPGRDLVRECHRRGITVVSVPGASAVTSAVAVSGLVDGPFLFVGFLPRKGKKRAAALARVRACEDPVVLFESPSRAHATLNDLSQAMPQRQCCIARELTKLHEEIVVGPLDELTLAEPARGEFVFVLGPGDATTTKWDEADLRRALETGLGGAEKARQLVERLAVQSGWPRRDVYQLMLAIRGR